MYFTPGSDADFITATASSIDSTSYKIGGFDVTSINADAAADKTFPGSEATDSGCYGKGKKGKKGCNSSKQEERARKSKKGKKGRKDGIGAGTSKLFV